MFPCLAKMNVFGIHSINKPELFRELFMCHSVTEVLLENVTHLIWNKESSIESSSTPGEPPVELEQRLKLFRALHSSWSHSSDQAHSCACIKTLFPHEVRCQHLEDKSRIVQKNKLTRLTVPVLPRPLLQCTATASPLTWANSQTFRNLLICFGVGASKSSTLM